MKIYSALFQKSLSSKHFRRSGNENVRTAQSKTKSIEETKHIPWRLWGELAESLRGFPRHLGIHSGGFIISQSD
ncbi:MAG: hypothetical protein R2827_11005 [Bdellovibrionales bacterium]